MSETLHVLQLLKGLDIGGASGGSDKYGFELSLALKKAGVHVAVGCFNQFGTATEQDNLAKLKAAGIPNIILEEGSTFSKLHSLDLQNFCRDNQIDIVHSHFPVGNLAGSHLRAQNAVKAVVRTAHISKEWGDGVIAWVCRQVFSGFLYPLLTDQVVGVSQAITDQLNHTLGGRLSHHKAITIYNGIPERWFTQGSAPLQKELHLIGAAGLLIERKGFDHLIRAMPAILTEYSDARLMILGEGPQHAVLEALIAELHLEQKVKLLGNQSDLPNWLSRMDIFVLPSWVEGLPTVLLESMACQTPVIATDIPGTRELVLDGQTGWLVQPGSVEQISEAVKRAFSQREAYVCIQAQAYAWAQNFTIERAVQQYLALYQQLVKG
jgi:glycosyltransferase involved in cell wall biosynthesis